MKCVYHKQDPSWRIQQRGSQYYVQWNSGSQGTRELDPWQDIGMPKVSELHASYLMYQRKPLVQS